MPDIIKKYQLMLKRSQTEFKTGDEVIQKVWKYIKSLPNTIVKRVIELTYTVEITKDNTVIRDYSHVNKGM